MNLSNHLKYLVCLSIMGWTPAWSLGMTDLISLAFAGNPSLRSQERMLDSAQADVQAATNQFWPTPSITTELARSSISEPNYSRDKPVTTLRLQQPLWTGGRLTAGVEKARASADAAQAAVEEQRQQLALRTIQAWGDWRVAQQKTLALQESVRTHQRLRDQIGRRVEIGVSAPADGLLAQGRLEQTQAELGSVQAQELVARLKLEQLTGTRWTTVQLTGYTVEPLDQLLRRADLVDVAWQSSPQLKKLTAQVQVQMHEIDIKKAQMLPEVYLRAERQQGNFSGLPSSNRMFIGLSASPGAGLSLMSGIQSAVARADAAMAEADMARRSIAEQVGTEQALGLSQQQRRTGLEASLRSTEAMISSWDRQFLAGRKTWVEVMNAARELAQSQSSLADASVGHVVSTWRLAVISDGLPASPRDQVLAR